MGYIHRPVSTKFFVKSGYLVIRAEKVGEDADGNTVDIWTYWEWGVIRCCDGIIIETSSIDEQYQTYEEAVEAAILYSLKNLI